MTSAGVVPELPPSLVQHVRSLVQDDIRAGRLRPGDRLAEIELMRRTGVSRTPIREAMQQLEAEGLVVASRNRGVRIAPSLTRAQAALIYDCRLALEPHLTAEATERLSATELDAIGELCEHFESRLDRSTTAAQFSDVDSAFHRAIYRASDSPLLVVFRSYWSRLQVELTQRVYRCETPANFHGEHLGILAALRDRDADSAATRMHEHLAHGRRVLDASFAGEEQPR